MKNKIILLLLCTYTMFAQVNFYKDTLYKADISAKQAYEMQQQGAMLIDIRTAQEFKTEHPRDSINIPIFYAQNGQRVFNKKFLQMIYTQSKENLNQTIILICRSGSRTKVGSNILAKNGFKNIYNVKKGFAYDWKKVNLPTQK